MKTNQHNTHTHQRKENTLHDYSVSLCFVVSFIFLSFSPFDAYTCVYRLALSHSLSMLTRSNHLRMNYIIIFRLYFLNLFLLLDFQIIFPHTCHTIKSQPKYLLMRLTPKTIRCILYRIGRVFKSQFYAI